MFDKLLLNRFKTFVKDIYDCSPDGKDKIEEFELNIAFLLIKVFKLSVDDGIFVLSNMYGQSRNFTNYRNILSSVVYVDNDELGVIEQLGKILRKYPHTEDKLLSYIQLVVSLPNEFKNEMYERCVYTICSLMSGGLKIPFEDLKRLFEFVQYLTDGIDKYVLFNQPRTLVEIFFVPKDITIYKLDAGMDVQLLSQQKDIKIIRVGGINSMPTRDCLLSTLSNSENSLPLFADSIDHVYGHKYFILVSMNELFDDAVINILDESHANIYIYHLMYDLCILEVEIVNISDNSIRFYEMKHDYNVIREDFCSKDAFIERAFDCFEVELKFFNKKKNGSAMTNLNTLFYTEGFKNFNLNKLLTLRNDYFDDANFELPIFTNDLSKKVSTGISNNYISSFYKLNVNQYDLSLYIDNYSGCKDSLRTINHDVLIVNKKNYLPVFFNASNGGVLVDIYENYIFSVKDYVLPVYIASELNKLPFIYNNVLNNKYKSFNLPQFLSSYVGIPDCYNSLERQRQIVKDERCKYLKDIVDDFEAKIEINYNSRNNALKPGTELDFCIGNENKMFIIRDVIGCGGFALTYKAIEVGSNYDRTVAVKEFFVASMQTRVNCEVESVLSSNLENLFRAKTKFRSEAEKIRQLANCHNIIDVYDVFDKNGTSYYTMEYVDGCDLRYYCESYEEGYLKENEALNIISELCKAVKAMHNINMNHLDIKPDNIMIENNTGRIILIDFGTATRIADNEQTFILDCVSNGYTPIENTTIQDFCPQKDIYSIGATLYFLLTGCDPPSSSDLMRKWDNWNKLDGISEKAWQIIESAMQPDFRNRPSNIEALEMIIG